MKRGIKFAIAGLTSAGFLSMPAVAGDEIVKDESNTFVDKIQSLIETMSSQHEYSLAGHSSHVSHGSHGSHGSHQSYYKSPEIYKPDEVADRSESGIILSSMRNEQSTPTKSILPSSYSVAKKLKILPGNTEKFSKIVTQAQLSLLARGYEVGSVSGALDAKSMSAIFKFQSDNGFNATGKLTPEVLSALNVSAV